MARIYTVLRALGAMVSFVSQSSMFLVNVEASSKLGAFAHQRDVGHAHELALGESTIDPLDLQQHLSRTLLADRDHQSTSICKLSKTLAIIKMLAQASHITKLNPNVGTWFMSDWGGSTAAAPT